MAPRTIHVGAASVLSLAFCSSLGLQVFVKGFLAALLAGLYFSVFRLEPLVVPLLV